MRPTPPKPAPVERVETWERKVQVELLTRLFGGGARARELDPVGWLRSAAAKSAIRAWWRAGAAHRFSSLAELREREGILFGTSTRYDEEGRPKGGPGALTVTVQSRLCSAPQEYGFPPSDPLQVAFFPAAPLNQGAAKLGIPESTPFTQLALSSTHPDAALREELLEGLRLWLTLGGAGARTRRGAGAIGLKTAKEAGAIGLPGSLEELKGFLRLRCSPHTMAPELAPVFCLAHTRRVLLGPLENDAQEAQRKLLRALRATRQERTPGAGGYGRSKWPEADAVRFKAGGAYSHTPDPANRDQYPRAALGLPIVMHFKGGPEPQDHHVLAALPGKNGWDEPVKLDRFASPILLRPVRIWEGKQVRYVPVALFTDCTLPADARPLVVTDPRAKARSADVVAAYGIASHADATLARIEAAFLNEGFRSL
jgi:CRISPR-associated protein Cmr1